MANTLRGERGFTADIKVSHVRPRRKIPLVPITLLVSLSIVLLGVAVTTSRVATTTPSEPEFPPGMNVITLNQTLKMEITEIHCTVYFFEGFENFTDLRERYSTSLGMLIFNCSGPNETLLLMIPGQTIEHVAYQGQSLIAVGSWVNTGFYANGSIFSETWGGMENASRAWDNGAWDPTVGLVIEHGNIILGDAQLDILCLVRTVPIPEFGLTVTVLATVVVVIAVRGAYARNARK